MYAELKKNGSAAQKNTVQMKSAAVQSDNKSQQVYQSENETNNSVAPALSSFRQGPLAMQFKTQSEGAAPQAQTNEAIQRKPNNTGLPDNLKAGIENLSGYSMDDVKVHYNSSKPAQLQAYAFAQGTDIHLASGQERHLPHEAWHVVQQKLGRVRPTLQMKEL